MLKYSFYRGRFGFRKNCSLIHHILLGESVDGHPVIVFPKDPIKVVEDKVYEFLAQPTLKATYTIESDGSKTVYRVVHALEPRAVDNSEGDFVDQIVHRTSGDVRTPPIADRIPGGVLAKLQALRSRL